ncbi:MAG TPA: acetyl-coenzyme A synthetase N-terminal domain-containing protein, partial [Vicinamibacterales bacterium]|nr:acetyl-coenzyme A synthetase N-terminal domain-containing protein [Vicinamibacterales bacterium]
MPSSTFEFGGEIAWRPSREVIERSRLTAFMRRHGLPGVGALLERSTTDLEWFWRAVFEDLGVEFYEPFTQVVDLSKGPAWARWCVGARLNIVHNCLD